MGQFPDGILIVGRLMSKTDGAFTRLTIACDGVDSAGQPVVRTRQVEYRGYSASSGQPSRVTQALASVKEGEKVCVQVFVKTREGGISGKTGKPYPPFTVYEALDVLALDKNGQVQTLKPVSATA